MGTYGLREWVRIFLSILSMYLYVKVCNKYRSYILQSASNKYFDICTWISSSFATRFTSMNNLKLVALSEGSTHVVVTLKSSMVVSDQIIALKVSKYGVFSGPYFPAFGLNTERYSVSLRIQSEYRKMRTRRNSVFEHFSRSGCLTVFVHSFKNYPTP